MTWRSWPKPVRTSWQHTKLFTLPVTPLQTLSTTAEISAATTPEQDFELILIAGYILDSAIEVPPIIFRDDADFERHISERRSLFQSNVELSPDGRIIVSLCTCTGTSKSSRLIIAGKMVPTECPSAGRLTKNPPRADARRVFIFTVFHVLWGPIPTLRYFMKKADR